MPLTSAPMTAPPESSPSPLPPPPTIRPPSSGWPACALTTRVERGRCVVSHDHEGPLRLLKSLYPEGDGISPQRAGASAQRPGRRGYLGHRRDGRGGRARAGDHAGRDAFLSQPVGALATQRVQAQAGRSRAARMAAARGDRLSRLRRRSTRPASRLRRRRKCSRGTSRRLACPARGSRMRQDVSSSIWRSRRLARTRSSNSN